MVRVRAKAHSQEFMNAFNPVRKFLIGIGQLPFQIQKRADGTYAFRFKKSSVGTVLFGITSFFYCLIYAMSSVGLFFVLTEFYRMGWYAKISFNINVKTTSPTRQLNDTPSTNPWEQVMTVNHTAIVLFTHAQLTMTFVGIWFVILNQSDYVHYFNYWNKVVQAVHMNPTGGVGRPIRIRIFLTIILVIAEIVIFWTMVGLRAVSGVYATFLLKPFVPDLPSKFWFLIAELIGLLIIMYGTLGARAIILQFTFFCILLKNVANIWNDRLRHVLKSCKDISVTMEHRRHEFRCLLKDHLVIVQLYKMTESTFALILTTFFFTELVCLIFEGFSLWKIIMPSEPKLEIITIDKDGEQTIQRPPIPTWTPENELKYYLNYSEGIIIIVLFCSNWLNCFWVTGHAHKGYMEAMQGFQIIRRHSLMDCSKSERNFMYSMIVSFARNNPLIVSANGFFVLNKALLAAILSSLAAYFILTIQFEYNKYVVRRQDYRDYWGPPKP